MADELPQELSEEMLEEMENVQSDDEADAQENKLLTEQEFMDAYGAPEPEEVQNAHSFLHKATFDSQDTVKTTFLSESELGRPLFNVRFLLDLHDISKYYLDSLALSIGLKESDNKIAGYFWEKIQNITASGMSNKGFGMNLNVTRKIDATRKRMKDIQPLQGGKVK